MAYKYPQDYPEFEDVLVDFSNENPEYRDLLRARTHALVENVFLDEDGEVLPEKTINRNRELTRVRIFHILKQLKENPRWQMEKTRLDCLPLDGDVLPNLCFSGMPPAGDTAGAMRISASDEEWKEAPRTMLKTLQEIFTAPTERIAFSRSEICGWESGWSRFAEEEYLTGGQKHKFFPSRDLSCIVIDPALLNATRLKNLGLEEYIPEKGKKMTPAERMAVMAGAIPEIKKILSSLESIRLPFNLHENDDNYFRLMRIGTGKKEGYVLGTQIIRGKKTIFVTDIHKALRRIFHITGESYKTEIRLLRELESEILKIHTDLEKWPMQDEEAENIRAQLHRMSSQLKYVTDEDKVKIGRLIDASVDLKTKRSVPAKYSTDPKTGMRVIEVPSREIEQINPKATRARLYPARIKKFFQSRMDRIRHISAHLSQDNVVSEDYIARQQIPFDDIMDLFENKSVGVNMDRLPTAQSKMRARQALTRIKKSCSFTPEGNSFAEPYLSFSRKVLEHADETIRLLDDDADRTVKAAEFMKIYFVAKIQRYYARLQKIYGKHISPAEVPDFGALSRDLANLQRDLFQKKVKMAMVKEGSRNHVILKSKCYSAAYEKIYAFLKALRECSAEADKLQAHYPEKTDDLKRLQQAMRKHVREFDFTKLMDSIVPTDDDGNDYVIEESKK